MIVSSVPYSTPHPPTTQPNTSADNSPVASLTQPDRHIRSYGQPPTQALQHPHSFNAQYDSHKRIEAVQTGIQHSQSPPQRTDRTAPSKAQKADKPPDTSSVRPEGGQSADRNGDISHVEADTSFEDKISGDSKTHEAKFPPLGGEDVWFPQGLRSPLSRRKTTKAEEISFKYRSRNKIRTERGHVPDEDQPN